MFLIFLYGEFFFCFIVLSNIFCFICRFDGFRRFEDLGLRCEGSRFKGFRFEGNRFDGLKFRYEGYLVEGIKSKWGMIFRGLVF